MLQVLLGQLALMLDNRHRLLAAFDLSTRRLALGLSSGEAHHRKFCESLRISVVFQLLCLE